MADTSAVPAASPAPEKPDFEALQRTVASINEAIESAKAKRERCQAKITASKGSNDEINVSAAVRRRRGALGRARPRVGASPRAVPSPP